MSPDVGSVRSHPDWPTSLAVVPVEKPTTYEDSNADPNDEFEIDAEEIVDLGNGVTLGVLTMDGRPVGSTGHVR